MFKRKSMREPVPETEEKIIGMRRSALIVYAQRFQSRTGNKTVSWIDIKLALKNKRQFIVADGKKYNLLEVLPEMYR